MTRKPPDSIDTISAAWKGIYRQGDAALAAAKKSAGQDDMQGVVQALEAFKLVREQMTLLRPMEDLAMQGRKFSQGRKLNSGGPIRKAIAGALSKDGTLKNQQLWNAIAKNPPKGWTFNENRAGKYIEGPRLENMQYARFCNVCSEERAKLVA